MQELGDGEEYCEMLSSRHAIAIVHRNSHQLWLLAQDLHKIKPNKIFTSMGSKIARLQFLLRYYCRLITAERGRIICFLLYCHC